jgi:UDPglucose 6-dehydrogenase
MRRHDTSSDPKDSPQALTPKTLKEPNPKNPTNPNYAIMTKSMRVAVSCTGHVGLTSVVCLAYLGHRVGGMDKDNAKVEMLKAGKVPIHEPGLPELLSSVRGKVRSTNEIREAVPEAEVILIAVGTPAEGERRGRHSLRGGR